MSLIKELKEGEHVSLQAIIGTATKGINASGSMYLNVELRDSSGQINAKKWDISEKDNEIFISGNIIEVVADVISYKDNLQLKILTAKGLSSDEVDITRFIKAPPIPKEELIVRFNKLVDSIKDEDCKKILDYFIDKYKDCYYDAPAAVSVHHEFASGLLMHSLSIAEIADFLASYYKDVNRDLLITAALLHDVGKLTELEGPGVYKYSLKGKLLGHISIMGGEIAEVGKLLNITSEVPLLLEHMILSHHGEREYGSPVLPLTREALLLSLIDSLDSKMLILDKAYEDVEKGDFTQKVMPLDGRIFYKAK